MTSVQTALWIFLALTWGILAAYLAAWLFPEPNLFGFLFILIACLPSPQVCRRIVQWATD